MPQRRIAAIAKPKCRLAPIHSRTDCMRMGSDLLLAKAPHMGLGTGEWATNACVDIGSSLRMDHGSGSRDPSIGGRRDPYPLAGSTRNPGRCQYCD